MILKEPFNMFKIKTLLSVYYKCFSQQILIKKMNKQLGIFSKKAFKNNLYFFKFYTLIFFIEGHLKNFRQPASIMCRQFFSKI